MRTNTNQEIASFRQTNNICVVKAYLSLYFSMATRNLIRKVATTVLGRNKAKPVIPVTSAVVVFNSSISSVEIFVAGPSKSDLKGVCIIIKPSQCSDHVILTAQDRKS